MRFRLFLCILVVGFSIYSCNNKNESVISTTQSRPVAKKTVSVKEEPTPVCKLTMKDIIGNYANKSGFSAQIKTSEKDSSKVDFVFQISKGCVRRYSGTASKEEYFSENELNYVAKDSINKIAIEITMFFSEGKLSIAERTSEKKEKANEKCLFEGHLTKLK